MTRKIFGLLMLALLAWMTANTDYVYDYEALAEQTAEKVTCSCGNGNGSKKMHNQSEQSDQIWAITTPNGNEDILKGWDVL